MSKPTLFQIGCFYLDAETLNVGRATQTLDGLWSLLSYDGSTFDVPQDNLRVACKEDMRMWHVGASSYHFTNPL